MINPLRRLFLRSAPPPPSRWRHFSSPVWPAAVYAIGDIHGCLRELQTLERIIIADAQSGDGPVWIVYLGDMIDRGPNPAGVIDHLLRPLSDRVKRICLGGNHEAMMLDFLAAQANMGWLNQGGAATLSSYVIDADAFARRSKQQRLNFLASHIPAEHVQFLRSLLLTASLPGAVFVHAGLRHGVGLSQQREEDLLWSRDTNRHQPWQAGTVVVHGHTPAQEAVMLPHRICVDTGAFATGRLTAVKLTEHGNPRLLSIVNHHH